MLYIVINGGYCYVMKDISTGIFVAKSTCNSSIFMVSPFIFIQKFKNNEGNLIIASYFVWETCWWTAGEAEKQDVM